MLRGFQILLVLGLLGSSLVRAENSSYLTPQETRELDLSLRVQTILLESQKQIGDAEAKGPVSDSELEKILKGNAEKIVAAYLPPETKTQLQKITRGMVEKLSWKNAVHHVREMAAGARTVARKKGLPVAGGLVLGIVMEPTVPILLAAVGLPGLIPLSFAFPFPVIVPGVIVATQNKILEGKLMAMYGGAEKYRQVQAEYAKARTEIGRRGISDVLVPLLNDGEVKEALVVTQKGLVGGWLERFGLGSKEATYRTLARVFSKVAPKDPLFLALESDAHIPEVAKAVLLAHRGFSSGDPALVKALRQELGSRIVALPHLNSGLQALEVWAREFGHVESLDQAREMWAKVPKGTPPKLVARLWSEAILPSLSDSLSHLSGAELKALEAGARQLMARAELSSETEWSDTWAERGREALPVSALVNGPDRKCGWSLSRLWPFRKAAAR